MKSLLKIFAILVIFTGLILIMTPGVLMNYLRGHLNSPSVYYLAITIRFVIGILLIYAARQSSYPFLIRLLGYIFVAVAAGFLLMGQSRFQEAVKYFIDLMEDKEWVAGLVAVAFGFLIWHVFPSRNNRDKLI